MHGDLVRKPLRDWMDLLQRGKVAKRLGCSHNTVHRWFYGKAIPSGPNLLALAELLGISADQIILSPVTRDEDHA